MQETELLARFSILLILFVSRFISAQVYPDREIDSLLKAGINNIIVQDYNNAGKEFSELNTAYPKLPLGKIYLAALKIAEAFDYAQPFEREFIEGNLSSAIEQSEELLDENPDSLWYNYFYALSEGYSAYYSALNNDWFEAFSSGMNSIQAFEKCLDIDENFYEAYIAIGTFEYWKSRKTEFLNWMPFYDDDRDMGVQNLQTAGKYASYNSYLAINSLIWIYIDKEDYESAIKLGESVLKQFPNSRYFKLGLSRAYEDVDAEKSINLYYQILNSYPSNISNNINKIILKHLVAQQLVKLGKKESAIQICNEILMTKNLTDYEEQKLENRLIRVRELWISLEK